MEVLAPTRAEEWCGEQVVYLGGQPYAVIPESSQLARDWGSYGNYAPSGDAPLRGTPSYPG